MSLAAPPDQERSSASQLARSRDYCRELTRTAARNFYYGLKLLPEPKRSAMFALYAYMRIVDDIADDDDHGRSPQERSLNLESWRQQTHAVARGDAGAMALHDVWPAFADLVRHYRIPAHIFDEVIAGQRQDLEPVAFTTFEELGEYCYRVAGVVGLASIRVWGYTGGAGTEQLAVARGVAFQLTNILRDLREDASRGRVYLPREDFDRFDIKNDDLLPGGDGRKFDELMRFQIDRAESFYAQSRELEHRVERDSRPTLIAMTEIYHGLLRKIAAEPARVLRERVSLSILSKLRIGWRAVRATRAPSHTATSRASQP
jgi:phytoene synthase